MKLFTTTGFAFFLLHKNWFPTLNSKFHLTIYNGTVPIFHVSFIDFPLAWSLYNFYAVVFYRPNFMLSLYMALFTIYFGNSTLIFTVTRFYTLGELWSLVVSTLYKLMSWSENVNLLYVKRCKDWNWCGTLKTLSYWAVLLNAVNSVTVSVQFHTSRHGSKEMR
jgi:hypothetical protein